jgi:ABC-type nitrate/sulfonate/bicarbonate transport system permease component
MVPIYVVLFKIAVLSFVMVLVVGITCTIFVNELTTTRMESQDLVHGRSMIEKDDHELPRTRNGYNKPYG